MSNDTEHPFAARQLDTKEIDAIWRKPMLTSGDAARLCGVAPRTICKWVDKGYLKGARLPPMGTAGHGDRRIVHADFLAFCRSAGLTHIVDRLTVLSRVLALGLPAELHDAHPCIVPMTDAFSLGREYSRGGAGVILDCDHGGLIAILGLARHLESQMVPVLVILPEDGTGKGKTDCPNLTRPVKREALAKVVEAMVRR